MTQLDQDMVVSKWCNLSPDQDDDRTKKFKIELVIPAGTTITDLANSCLATSVIKWQNARRKKWVTLVDGSIHRMTYKRPISEVDPEDAMVAKLQAMDTDEDRAAYIAEMLTKAAQ